jgi:hypothetical protein
MTCLPDDVSSIDAAIDAGLAELLTVSGGVAFAYGEIGYLHTDGTVRKAQADSTDLKASAAVICIVTAGVADGASGAFRYLGPVTFPTAVGTAGALVYVGITPGSLTTTLPVSPTSAFSKVVGRWRTTTVLWFAPSPEIAPFAL